MGRKRNIIANILSRPVVWAPLLGLIPLAAYPPLEWHLTAWLGLAPLMLALCARKGGVGGWFLAGWGYGMVFYSGQFLWLQRTFVELAGLGWPQFLGFFLLLVSLLGLFFATGIAAVRWGWLRRGWHPCWTLPLWLTAQELLLEVFPFGGVAWGSLAATQPHTVAARLVAPVLGGAGLVLVISALNAGWAWAVRAALRPGAPGSSTGPYNGRPAFVDLKWGLTVLALATLVLAWPAPRTAPPPGAPSLTALMVPGDLTTRQLDAAMNTNTTVRYYLARTLAGFDATEGKTPEQGVGNHKALVIWPESAARGALEKGKTLVELSQMGELLHVDFLLGANARQGGRDLNSLYLVQGGALDFRRYDKRRLVPFGEYVPPGFGWIFGKKITQGETDFAAGSKPPLLSWQGSGLGLAICFESVLPAHIRMAVRGGARMIVAVANDAWLTGAAARHHLKLTALRGLEAGRDVLFVSNGGENAWLRDGRVFSGGTGHKLAFWTHPALRDGLTIWVRWGAWPLLAVLAAWAVCGVLFSPEKSPPG